MSLFRVPKIWGR